MTGQATVGAGTEDNERVGRHMTGDVLKVENLRVWFHTPAGMLRAVDGVDLSLRQGETLGVVGESGSGKSVMSRAIMKILPRNAEVLEGSRILLHGRDLAGVNPKKEKHLWGVDLAMVFQDPMTSLTPVMTVGHQLSETLRYHRKLDRKAARSEAVDLLRRVGIPEPEKRYHYYPHNLSGGMRQRVTIALAISCSPKLLIADEPTTALDVTVQHQILNLLQSLQESASMSMILVTHDLGVVAGRADHIAVMYAGRVVERAPTRQLFRQMRHPYTRALIDAIPKVGMPSQTTLASIPGRPPVIIDPPPGCSFAPRCPSAQDRCLKETPELTSDADSADHAAACFYPLGTPAGDAARQRNIEAGVSAAGTPVTSGTVI